MGERHAILSPSAAHRWLRCTAAPLLEANEPDRGTAYTEEGRLAHAMCARKLKKWMGMPYEKESMEISELWDAYHTGEMDEHVETYKTLVLERFAGEKKRLDHARLLVEVRLDFGEWVPGAFGTSDAVIIGDGVAEVIDFKYGKGVRVDAEENPQMMIYALGALDRFDDYDIRTVRMTVVQPRLAHLSRWEASADDLRAWAEDTLRPKAQEAMSGGSQQPGDWCRFCKVKGHCSALADYVTGFDRIDPKLMDEAKVSECLAALPLIKQWAASVEEYALASALQGVRYPGYKLVEGRSVRKVTDTMGAIAALQAAGFDSSSILKPIELKGITDLEKTVGKKKLAEICADFITKPKGKPTLVEASDKRPALDLAAEMFGAVEDNV